MSDQKIIPSFDLTRNFARVREEIKVAVDRVLETQHFVLGPEVDALERELGAYLEVENAIGCASGTDALVLAMMSLDLKPGDEVITTPFSFFATASCIVRSGAKAVFADVDPHTYNITAQSVFEKITFAFPFIIIISLSALNNSLRAWAKTPMVAAGDFCTRISPGLP